ncbi:MAG: carbon storage regulator CsrA [Oscillospiraceae bacterium]|nr:carbon storage regulator CsrA [Oscillospiraceae bacterium]
MLVLSRKIGETVLLDSALLDSGIEIKITEISGDRVKIGITAPANIKVYREELYATIQENQTAAKAAAIDEVKDFFLRMKE